MDLNSAVTSLTSLKDWVSSFTEYEREGIQRCGTADYLVTQSQQRCPSVNLKHLDYGDGEKAHLTPFSKYKTE